VDEVAQDPANIDPASVRRHGSDDLEPTGAAELYIVLLPGNWPGGRADVPDPGPSGSFAPPGAPLLRRFDLLSRLALKSRPLRQASCFGSSSASCRWLSGRHR
jgi:hypothetical protein